MLGVMTWRNHAKAKQRQGLVETAGKWTNTEVRRIYNVQNRMNRTKFPVYKQKMHPFLLPLLQFSHGESRSGV